MNLKQLFQSSKALSPSNSAESWPTRLCRQLASPCCIICRHPLESSNTLCSYCMHLHERSLLKPASTCLRCALPLESAHEANKTLTAAPSLICAECQNQPPLFKRCIAAATFEALPAQLIRRCKHHGKASAANFMGTQLCAAIESRLPEQTHQQIADCIIPVPLHPLRMRQRGFNQASLIAAPIAKALGIPLEENACTRLQMNDSQQSLNRAARKKNLENAFAAKPGSVAGKRVAIVDDVVTTGTTANELAKTLLKAGAVHCEIWSYARTPSPNETISKAKPETRNNSAR